MRFVPVDVAFKSMLFSKLAENDPVAVAGVGPIPVPSTDVVLGPKLEDFRDEIDGEPELVRALPSARFRGAFGKKVVLPVGTAQTLERFEAELRAVGFIGRDEILRQSAKLPSHFRVQFRDGKRASGDIHDLSSIHREAPEWGTSAFRERAPTLRCRERNASPEPVSGERQPVIGKRAMHILNRRSRPAL